MWQTVNCDSFSPGALPAGTSIKVSLNGKTYINVQDNHISGAGAVGMWTKADSVTVFTDFALGAAAPAR